jgi:hypothetical protein
MPDAAVIDTDAVVDASVEDDATPAAHDRYDPPYPRIGFYHAGVLTLDRHDPQYYAKHDALFHVIDSLPFVEKIWQQRPEVLFFACGRGNNLNVREAPVEAMLWAGQTVTLTEPAQPGDTEIRVDTIEPFKIAYPGSDSELRLNGYATFDDGDMISYPKRFTVAFPDAQTVRIRQEGCAVQERCAISNPHATGEKIHFFVERGGKIGNFWPGAVAVEGKKPWEYFIDNRYADEMMFEADGTLYDIATLHAPAPNGSYAGWLLPLGIDFDRNGVDDMEEHGAAWINEQWYAGLQALYQYEREKWLQNTDKPGVIVTNSGAGHNSVDYLNGPYWEGFQQFTYYRDILAQMLAWRENGQKPLVCATEDFVDYTSDYHQNGQQSFKKNRWWRMRFGLTTALMSDCYYSMGFGATLMVYFPLEYDEYYLDLGYPTGDAVKLEHRCHTNTDNTGTHEDCVWVRFFDKGVAVLNASGGQITVTDADLAALDGYTGPYHRFRGNQDPETNNGQPFTEITLKGDVGSKYVGDGIILLDEPQTVVADIYVGNGYNVDTSPGQTPIEFHPAEAWSGKPERNTHNDLCFKFGDTYLGEAAIGRDVFCHHVAPYDPNGGQRYAHYPLNINVAGRYAVYEWHGIAQKHGDPEASNVLCTIHHAGQHDEVTVDQQAQSGQGKWNLLGEFVFDTSPDQYLRISADGANGRVIADAIKLVYLGASTDVPN